MKSFLDPIHTELESIHSVAKFENPVTKTYLTKPSHCTYEIGTMEDPLLIKTLFPSRFFPGCLETQAPLDGCRLLETRSREVSLRPKTATSYARIGSKFVQTTLKVDVVHLTDNSLETKSRMELHVEISRLCHYSRSKNQVLSTQLGCQLQQVLDSELIVERSSFRIPNSRSEFRITLQVIALDLDGALFETSLLSCLYALLRFDLLVFEVDMNGIAILAEDPDEGRRLKLHSLPIGFRLVSSNRI